MSRDQTVFADQATDASRTSDAVLVKVDRFGGLAFAASGGWHIQGPVSSFSISAMAWALSW